jgi:hypothetical protein
MAGLPALFLSETDPHSRNLLIILIIVEPDIPDETRLQHVHKNDWQNNVPQWKLVVFGKMAPVTQ